MNMAIEGRRVLVLGLGVSGLSMVRWLHAHGASVRVADSRPVPPGLATLRETWPGLPVHLGPFDAGVFENVDLMAVSPGVPLAEPSIRGAMAAGVPAVGDIELFAQALDDAARARGVDRPAVLAITGSNGKSTVTEMTGAICRAAGLDTLVAGNIGLPVLDAMSEIEAGRRALPDAVVLELSSFQLETTSRLRPTAAVVLNLSEDHLDRYADMSAYAAAKARIFEGAGVRIVNRDDPATCRMAGPDAGTWSFGLDAPAGYHSFGRLIDGGEEWLAEGAHRILPICRLKVAGLHNAANALAAIALARAIGVPTDAMADGLAAFRGLPHRVQFVDEIEARRFYDDSKGTNVGATVAALNGMREPVVLIAGGDGKGQDFAPLGPAAAARARAVVLIGRDRELIARALEPHRVRMSRAADMDVAVEQAFGISEAGDAILLSPACASFDMYRDYEHRAEAFGAAVARLRERHACSLRP